MKGLGIGAHLEMFHQVHAAYSEPHRHYHTVAHIDACLRELDSFRSLARSASEVEAALWFHDVIYVPEASDNETRSAELAARFLASAGLRPEACGRVHGHVLATTHDKEPADSDSALAADVDLSILGKEPAAYARFERQVRREYRAVPPLQYRRKRREVLRSFLERKSIYWTAEFRERYEARARLNIERAIARLVD
jgi:predicted metal-dependent HD superfamily phosphohydrolase